MTVSTKNHKELKEAFLLASEPAPSSSVFSDLKQQAREVLDRVGFPTIKDEEYKYTAISKRLLDKLNGFGTAESIPDIEKELRTQDVLVGAAAGYTIVCNNGRFEPQLSSMDRDLFELTALEDLESKAAARIGQIEKSEFDSFTALNSLFFKNGIHIRVPDGKIVSKPILLLNFVKSTENGSCVHPRTFIEVGKNAEVTLIERTISLGEEPVFVNSVCEWAIGQNAHVRHYTLQDGRKNDLAVTNNRADVQKDATFTSIVMSLEGEMIRNNLSLDLRASNCEGNMYGLYLLNGKTHVDNHTNVDHMQAHAESNELYKGILTDQSRGVFNGKIFVRQDAQKTNAFQQNNNILLSEEATVNTKPQLEIWADDVKCSHGCTTGQLDEEALFYLRARGIAKDAAKALLLHAFAGEVLDQIKEESFKEYCETLVHARLGGNY